VLALAEQDKLIFLTMLFCTTMQMTLKTEKNVLKSQEKRHTKKSKICAATMPRKLFGGHA